MEATAKPQMPQMPQMPPQNPLKQFFRQPKFYIKVPSGTKYYPPGVISFTDTGEVGIMPMTGTDELALKNPDALLNGEALIQVITSCVPAVSNPRALLTNDINALITAIRYATYNDTLETTINCPTCTHENNYRLDLQYALDNMSSLEPEYFVNLESGVTVFVRPYSFPELIKGLHSQFEQSKLAKAIENENITDAQRSEIFTKAFKEIAITKFDLMAHAVQKVSYTQDGKEQAVTDKRFIRDFLQNIDKKDVDRVGDLVDEINAIGIKKTFTAKCEKCEHVWESEIDFNPVNFS
jgi:hypothetical protein